MHVSNHGVESATLCTVHRDCVRRCREEGRSANGDVLVLDLRAQVTVGRPHLEQTTFVERRRQASRQVLAGQRPRRVFCAEEEAHGHEAELSGLSGDVVESQIFLVSKDYVLQFARTSFDDAQAYAVFGGYEEFHASVERQKARESFRGIRVHSLQELGLHFVGELRRVLAAHHLVASLHDVQGEFMVSTVVFGVLQRAHRTYLVSMYDEVDILFVEWQRRILESRIVVLHKAVLVQIPHFIGNLTCAHFGLQSTEHPGSADIHRQANDAGNGSPEIEALPSLRHARGQALVLSSFFVSFCFFDFATSKVVQRHRQASTGAFVLLYGG